MINLFVFEVCLILMMYLEPPGPWFPDQSLKTVSQCIWDHPGFGACLYVCVVVETSMLLQATRSPWLCGFLVFAAQASVMGVLFYPPSTHEVHVGFAGGFFVSALLLSLLRWAECLAVFVQVAAVVVSFVLVIVSFFVWPGAVGPLELVYFYFVVNAWVPTRTHCVKRALTSPLFA